MLTHPISRPKVRLCAAVLLGAMLFQSACGTIFYPERRGQTGGRIDPAIAILNGIGLLFFIIPGLIAFAIDFSTGAIYLPPDEGGSEGATLYLPPDQMTPERIEALIREHTGREVAISDQDVRVIELRDTSELDEEFRARSVTR